MAKICLLGHGQPSTNPRMVRDASAITAAGHQVTVITPSFMSNWVPHDTKIVEKAQWKFIPIDFTNSSTAQRKWNYIRFRRRISSTLSEIIPHKAIIARACAYSNPELAFTAAKTKSDLYIAYQHYALPAASWAANATHGRFACDVQDLLAQSPHENRMWVRSIEQEYLNECSYISTMSESAARHLQQTNKLSQKPVVLHNTPSLEERSLLLPPNKRLDSIIPSMYWFGLSLGPHSCAEQIIRAMALLDSPLRLVLRGNPIEPFVSELKNLAERFGLGQYLQIEPLASPLEMVRLAAQHDILLGTQPGDDLFHQMAIGNKVFTGMIAGLGLALTDTIAHREFIFENSGCGFVFSNEDSNQLAEKLNFLIANRSVLQQIKQTSWNLSEEKFNWEKESDILIRSIQNTFR
jgi:glycosyltransferase involved in cell wall biosynthesis